MATSDRYNYRLTGTAITDEIYNVSGTGTNTFGDSERSKGIYESSLEVWTGAGKTGTQLVLNTDYEFKNLDSKYTVQTGANIYAGWALINTATYNGVNLYFNYTGVGTYTNATDINRITTDLQQITDDTTITGGFQNHIIEATLTTVDKTLTLPSEATIKGELFRVVLDSTTSAKLTITPNSGDFKWKGKVIDPTLYEDGETIEFISDGTDLIVTRFDFDRIYHVIDEKAQNTAGGTASTGAWTTRVLNTEVGGQPNWIGTALSSNIATLPPGIYEAKSTSVLYRVNRTKNRLYNNTATAVIANAYSEAQYSNDDVTSNPVSCAIIGIRFEISVSSGVSLQYYAQTNGGGTEGLGVASNISSTTEKYADVIFEQVVPL